MRVPAISVVVGLSICAAGCGGGGGGSPAGGQNPGVPAPGASGQIVLTSTTSAPAAGFALGATEYAVSVSWELLRAADDALSIGLATSTEACFFTGTVTQSFTDADGNAELSVGDSILITFEACDSTFSGTERLILETLVWDNDVLTGIGGSVEHAQTDAGASFTIAGFHHVNLSFAGSGYDLELLQINLSVGDGQSTDTIFNASFTEHSDGAGDYQQTIQGRASSTGLGGSFTYATQPAFQGLFGQVPSSGTFIIRGSGTAARFATADLVARQATHELDLNGNGQYAATPNISWGALVGGPLFGFGYGSIYGNQGPEMTSLIIEPPDPVAGEDLSTDFRTRDPDGDPLTAAWQWQIDGVPQTDLTAATFPGQRATAGAVITVTVTVSDGELTASETASVTIGAPNLFLTHGQLPEAHFGELWTVPLTIADAQGGTVAPSPSLSFELVYGPAGMTVDPSLGILSWEPAIPVFEAQTAINFSVRVTSPAVVPVTGTLTLADPDRRYPILWAGIGTPEFDGVVVSDIDADGIDEILVLADANTLYELELDGQRYAQSWSYPFELAEAGVARAISARDTDNDGFAEIFVCVGTSIAVLDGRTRTVVTNFALPISAQNCSSVDVVDIDGDGQHEIVAIGNATLYVISMVTGTVIWQADGAVVPKVAVGNVDSDPALELVSDSGYVYDGATLELQWQYGPGFGTSIEVGDVDGDGVGEIVAAGNDQALRVFDAETMSVRAELLDALTFPAYGNTLALFDIQGDSAAEILIGTPDGFLDALGFDTATQQLGTLFRRTTLFSGTISSIARGDTDGDGDIEYVIAGSDGATNNVLQVASDDNGLITEWVNSTAEYLAGAKVGGKALHSAAAPTRIAYATGGDGGRAVLASENPVALAISNPLFGSSIGSARMDVADVDADGTEEVLLALRSASSGLTQAVAYDFDNGTLDWQSPPVFGDLDILKAADVNDDGRLDVLLLTRADGRTTIQIYDVFNGVLLWESNGQFGTNVAVLEDVANTFFMVGQTGIERYSRVPGSTEFVVTASYNGSAIDSWVTDLVSGDLDGDGTAELYAVVASRSLAPNTLARFNSSLQLLGTAEIPRTAWYAFVEDLGYARQNLVLAHDQLQGPGSWLSVADPRTGAEIMSSPRLHSAIQRNSLSYAAFDGDVRKRIAFSTGNGLFLTQ